MPLRPQRGSDALRATLLRPLEELRQDYSEAMDLALRLGLELGDLHDRVASGSAAREEPMAAGTSVPVTVPTEDATAILAFQRELAELPSVQHVSVTGMGGGRTTLLVELQEEGTGPSEAAIVCIECGRVLREGAEPVSHGLCPDCMPGFLRRNWQDD